MFKSATTKLTLGYLTILMVVSLLLSGIIFIVVDGEISGRMTNLSSRIATKTSTFPELTLNKLQQEEVDKTRGILLSYLYILNITIFTFGGVASYFVAKKNLQSIEDAQQAQARFISSASHELRTPLAAMKSELESCVLNKKATKKDYSAALISAVEEIDKMTELTTMLLDLSRVNTIEFDDKPLEINHAVQSVVDRINKPDLIKFKPAKPINIKGSEVALESVFTIIIDNALKYSFPNTPINIKVTQSGGRVRVAITNQGKGITKEDANNIFEHFYRGDDYQKKIKKGYGMGLALAKDIVEHHNGHIDVKSTTDKSTIFTVVIPRNLRSF